MRTAHETRGGHRELALVCDGVGENNNGGMAAKTAAEAFVDGWRKVPGAVDAEERLRVALEIANGSLRDRMQWYPELRGMATTLSAIELRNDRVHWITVGDSPIWLHEGGRRRMRRLNRLHNAPVHDQLGSALTGARIAEIDRGCATVQANDTLLIASDGLSGLGYAEISDTVEQNGPDLAARLTSKAIDASGDNAGNTTVIAIRIE